MAGSRKDIATDLFALSRTATNKSQAKSAKLAALILAGQWAPVAKARRPEGYRCLGLIQIQGMDEWREVLWDGSNWQHWCRFHGGGGEIFIVEPLQFAPLPIRR